ncbi:MAG: hypothetical protein RLZZ127_578 [Planctomycetota bacterium]|jgi:alpha-D-xyloside xylohydrolase
MSQHAAVLNAGYDPSPLLHDPASLIFLPQAATVDAAGAGTVRWTSVRLEHRFGFGVTTLRTTPARQRGFPEAYDQDLDLPWSVEPIGPRAVRLRMQVRRDAPRRPDPGILAGVPVRADWAVADDGAAITWRGPHGGVRVVRDPWRVELLAADGRVLTATRSVADHRVSLTEWLGAPTAVARRDADRRHHACLALALAAGDAVLGGGEDFGPVDKHGRRLHWWTTDAHGSSGTAMYKPVPMLVMESGWGVLCHTTAPVTADVGREIHDELALYLAEDAIDVILFIGSPAEILTQHADLVGRAPDLPLWSFGLWMSRITYTSAAEVDAVAAGMRRDGVPCDVIHVDTGWFAVDWQCDYRLPADRFPEAAAWFAGLQERGFRVSFWQLPYYAPGNPVRDELLAAGFAVTDGDGGSATEDAVLDFSHPGATAWYQAKLEPLLRAGVAAIKTDFGEAAPLHGRYASGQSGLYEHNRYPLRYQQAAAAVTRRVHGHELIWARAAWAGSQRQAVHWAGDGEATDTGMAGTLRGGLAFGMCGFTHWAHDAGGFPRRPDADLFLRWLAFACLSSHARVHGVPAREPWAWEDAGVRDLYRRIVRLRYRLLPYLWTQAELARAAGQPLLRALALDTPDDPEAWRCADAYRLGTDLLVAPLLTAGRARRVQVPAGDWRDLFTGAPVAGDGLRRLTAGALPIIVLRRADALIPVVEPAPHTGAIDWAGLHWVGDATGDGWLRGLDGGAPRWVRAHAPAMVIAAD